MIILSSCLGFSLIKDPLVVLDKHVAFSRPLNSWQPAIVGVTAHRGALSSVMKTIFIVHKLLQLLYSFTVFPAAAGATGPAQDPLWKENFRFFSVNTKVVGNVQCPCKSEMKLVQLSLIHILWTAPFDWPAG